MAGRALAPNAVTTAEPHPTNQFATMEQRIRARAHQIYLERGGEEGSALDDWLQAEAEVKSEEV